MLHRQRIPPLSLRDVLLELFEPDGGFGVGGEAIIGPDVQDE
jgi:hypothetical protein